MSLYVVNHVYIISNEIISNIYFNSCHESLHHGYHSYCLTYILFKYKVIITRFMREQCDIRGFQCDVIAGWVEGAHMPVCVAWILRHMSVRSPVLRVATKQVELRGSFLAVSWKQPSLLWTSVTRNSLIAARIPRGPRTAESPVVHQTAGGS